MQVDPPSPDEPVYFNPDLAFRPRMGMNGYRRNGQIANWCIEGAKLFARGVYVVIKDSAANQGGPTNEDWMLGGWKNCLLSITLGFIVIFLYQIYQLMA